MEFNLAQTIAIYALPVIFAITLHEAAHGYVARHFGDRTAFLLGRISLNPLRHIDPFGTIVLPLLTLGIMEAFGVGVPFGRSEERRVGKECRSGWSRMHQRNKIT